MKIINTLQIPTTGFTAGTLSSDFYVEASTYTRLIVLGIADASGYTRSPTIPTFGGINFSQVNTLQRAASSPEIAVEMWYLLNPSVGTNTISLVGDASMGKEIKVSSWASGFKYFDFDASIYFDSSVGSNGTSENPSITLSASDAGLVISMLGSGTGSIPTNYSGGKATSLLPADYGDRTSVMSYFTTSTKADTSIWYEISNNDWGHIAASFFTGTTPPSPFSLDTLLYYEGTTTNYTCGTGTTLFVLGIIDSSYPRAVASIPTYGGIPMTNISRTRYDHGECAEEMFYILNPSVNTAYSVTVPDVASDHMIYLRCVSFKSNTEIGDIVAYDASAWDASTIARANPSTNITVSANSLVLSICGDGASNLPSAYSDASILPVDHGAYTSWMTWKNHVEAGTYNVWNTVGADDWGLVVGSWKLTSNPVVPKYWGGILKYYTGSIWQECTSTQYKYFTGSTWNTCPSTNFKVCDGTNWYPIRMQG